MKEFESYYAEGQWATAPDAAVHAVVSPVTEEVSARVPLAGHEQAAVAIASARRAFDSGEWPRLTPQERADVLLRIVANLEERLEDLADAWSLELGTPKDAARQRIRQAIRIWRRSAQFGPEIELVEDRKLDGGRIARIVRQPVGTVLAITPWNAPLILASMKTSAALAAGCTVVIKPAAEAPFTFPILVEAAKAAGLPDGVLNIVYAGPEVTARMVQHPEIDMVTFTGSTAVGKQVMKACADSVKKVALELGGKSASIITDDVDPATTVAQVVAATGISLAGQTCGSRNRIVVPRSRHAEWREALVGAVGALVTGPPSDPAADVGPLATKNQRDRVEGFIQSAVDEGAELLVGGGRPDGLDTGWYIAPTLFDGVTTEMTIAREEIFGPVLSLMTYDSVEEAIEIANATDYGLAGSVFSGDPEKAFEIAGGVKSGVFQINVVGPALDEPFGGVKQSGLGREGGREGIEEFMEIRQIQFPEGFVPERIDA